MHNYSIAFVKVAAFVGVVVTVSFAGVEPSPFMPIWRIIIRIIGG